MDTQKYNNPWLGLESYKEGEVLYGRDDDIRDLTQCVLNDNSTLLHGKSGIGKSSILNAGVIPAARRQGYLPVPIRLSHKSETTYLQQIHEAIETAMIPLPIGEDGKIRNLAENEKQERQARLSQRIKEVVLRSDNETIYEYFHRHTFHNEQGERVNLLIIFDQFEEIFTLQTHEAAKRTFFAELADMLNDVMPASLQNKKTEPTIVEELEEVDLANASDLNDIFGSLQLEQTDATKEYVADNNIHFVFTIREDFLSEFEYYSASIPSLKQNRYGLRPLNEEQAAQIILRPIPGLISQDVARLIIEKVTGRTDFTLDGIPEIEVDSAVLSLYLNRLYDAHTGNTITAGLVEEKGGEIIASFYNEAIADISTHTVEYLEDMLLNGQGRRDNISVYDAIHDGNVTEEELETLCNKKKILRQFYYAGVLRVEYVHDILCPIIKVHKEEREAKRKAEEERRAQELETQRLLAEEERKRKELEEKAAKQTKAAKRKLYATIACVLILAFGGGLYYFANIHEYYAYYKQFTRIKGWPQGVGPELSSAECKRTPLYYCLSRNGWSGEYTDVYICTSNKVLPHKIRIASPEVSEYNNNEKNADEFADMLRKVTRLHFVPDERGNIDKEIAYHNNEVLFMTNYYHLPNGREAWKNYTKSDGRALEIRGVGDGNGADRMKLAWDSTGRVVSFMFYNKNEVCQKVADGVCGYKMVFKDNGTTWRIALNEYGRPINNDFNLIETQVINDTIITRYAKVNDINDIVLAPANGPLGYSMIKKAGNTSYLYVKDNLDPIATQTDKFDSNGNLLLSTIDGWTSPYIAAKTINTYDANDGQLTSTILFNAKGKPFITEQNGIYKREWKYEGDELVLEKRYNQLDSCTYSYEVRKDGNISKIITFDFTAQIPYVEKRDTILAQGISSTTYYGRNDTPILYPVPYELAAVTDTIICHRVEQSVNANSVKYEYFSVDDNRRVCPMPTQKKDDYSFSSYYSRVENYDEDGNMTSFQIKDKYGKILKSMMFSYLNGQQISRAAMGIEGTPVRCPKWEKEGLGYYQIYYNIDSFHDFVTMQPVNETGQNSVFLYDDSYKQVDFVNYKNESFKRFNGDTTTIQHQYSQMEFIDAENISNTTVAFLHILNKKSILYAHGFRDGDRILKIGTWVFGNKPESLERQWQFARKQAVDIEVMQYDGTKKKATICLSPDENEEYHILALTKEEEKEFYRVLE